MIEKSGQISVETIVQAEKDVLWQRTQDAAEHTRWDLRFTIENFPHVDGWGRETVTFVRTFELGHTRRRFDATMVFSEQRQCVVDYLGTHQHLAADVHLAVDDRGGLHLRTTASRWW